jgi:hypothetical protein
MNNLKEKDLIEDEGRDKHYLQGKDLSTVNYVGRAKPPGINEDEDHFKFMQIDVDYYTSKEFPGKS